MKKSTSSEISHKIVRLNAQGIVLVILTFLGLAIGMKIDLTVGVIPLFSIILLLVGFFIGIFGFYREVFKL